MPMEVGCGAARRQASEAPDQWRTAPRRLQGVAGHSGARGLQALDGPEPVGKHQIAKTVVEVHMIAASHAAQSMAAFAIRRFSAEAARPTATRIDSQATSEDGKEIGSG